MEHKLRFVVGAIQDAPWQEMIARWQRVESLGLDGLMLADHFVDFAQPTAPWFEAWTLWLPWQHRPPLSVSDY